MKLNIAVIFGGRCLEHEISVISALQAIPVIDTNKYQVIPIYISKEGVWYTGDKLLDLANYRNISALLSQCTPVRVDQNTHAATFYKVKKHRLFKWLTKEEPLHIDIVMPILHGANGEDGRLQGLLALMDIPYTSCNSLASAITMDKIATKIFLREAGIPVLDDLWFYAEEWITHKDELIQKITTKFNYPLIVKPSDSGSSIGISAVNNRIELEDAIDLAVTMSQRILIEPRIAQLREINCAVLGDHEAAQASICEEPVRGDAILSYRDKYAGGTKNGKLAPPKTAGNNVAVKGGMSSAKRRIPADIPEELTHKIQAFAIKAFHHLDCSGVVRIDFLYDTANQAIYLCEVNAIPGSLAFYLWENSGKNFADLIETLFALALKRYREEQNLTRSYTDNILGM